MGRGTRQGIPALHGIPIHMCDGEEIWQVAGRRGRRRLRMNEARHKQQPDTHRFPDLQSVDRAASTSGTKKNGKGKGRALNRYAYSKSSNGNEKSPLQQTTDEDRRESVSAELAKLELLKGLLRETALWQRLTEGLRYVLPQLGVVAADQNEVTPTITVSDKSSPPAKTSTMSSCPRKIGVGCDTPNSSMRRRRRPRVLCELVCYGIGNFSENPSSRYQLALALCLRDSILRRSDDTGVPEEDSTYKAAMLVFDPVMGETEKEILAALGCGVLKNEEGKRCCVRYCESSGDAANEDKCVDKASDEGRTETVTVTPTLFFMPHCPQRLYSNVLWANWSSCALGSMLILGNKISSYRDRLLDAHAREDPTNAVLRAGPLVQEIDLLPYPASDKARWRRDVERLPRLERAFNDLTLSFSGPDARESAEGVQALLDRPQEFLEEVDGELVTGRVGIKVSVSRV